MCRDLGWRSRCDPLRIIESPDVARCGTVSYIPEGLKLLAGGRAERKPPERDANKVQSNPQGS